LLNSNWEIDFLTSCAWISGGISIAHHFPVNRCPNIVVAGFSNSDCIVAASLDGSIRLVYLIALATEPLSNIEKEKTSILVVPFRVRNVATNGLQYSEIEFVSIALLERWQPTIAYMLEINYWRGVSRKIGWSSIVGACCIDFTPVSLHKLLHITTWARLESTYSKFKFSLEVTTWILNSILRCDVVSKNPVHEFG